MLRRGGASGSLAGRVDGRASLGSTPLGTRRAAVRASTRLEISDAAPPREERVTATIPAKFRGRARRDAAAFYLSQLAKGVLAGELSVGTGERPTALAAAEFVILEIEVKQKKRANHVAVKLRWPKRPLIRVGAGGRGSHGR